MARCLRRKITKHVGVLKVNTLFEKKRRPTAKLNPKDQWVGMFLLSRFTFKLFTAASLFPFPLPSQIPLGPSSLHFPLPGFLFFLTSIFVFFFCSFSFSFLFIFLLPCCYFLCFPFISLFITRYFHRRLSLPLSLWPYLLDFLWVMQVTTSNFYLAWFMVTRFGLRNKNTPQGRRNRPCAFTSGSAAWWCASVSVSQALACKYQPTLDLGGEG